MRLSLRGLRTFCLSARYLSFKEAADELCLSASAVSHQIADLEEELQVKLFTRLTRSIALTHKGSQFYEEVNPHLKAIQEAAERVRNAAHRTPLLVQTPEFFASEMLMPMLRNFSDIHDTIDLRIESKDKIAQANPRADINIVLSRKQPGAEVFVKLFPILYVPACSRQLYQKWQREGRTTLEALNSATVLLHKARPRAWSQWAEHAGIGHLVPKQLIFVDSMFALARAAEQGAGIALVPMPVSKSWFESGALMPIHDMTLVTEDFYWMCLSAHAQELGVADVFWRWVLDHLPQHLSNMAEVESTVA